jgi:hypothetical protein
MLSSESQSGTVRGKFLNSAVSHHSSTKAPVFSNLLGSLDVASLLKLAEKQFGLKMKPLALAAVPAAEELRAIAESAIKPGAQFVRMSAEINGSRVLAFVVIEGSQLQLSS